MSEKLCRDCKYCVPSDSYGLAWSWWPFGKREYPINAWKYAKCWHPKVEREAYHLVAGVKQESKHYCANMRTDFKHMAGEWCGSEGKWFEPK